MWKDVSSSFTAYPAVSETSEDFEMWGQVWSLNILRLNNKKRIKIINNSILLGYSSQTSLIIWLNYISIK